ncbi:MAG: type II toxin-antitoxin system RelE/ParE family toxin [Bacteroidaceae bacterium]|nr:type II toxin-antitoxin system RelE/ParE family toxin [Bacteroidaceae bacterium]
MGVELQPHPNFNRQLKRLRKKYKSLHDDLALLGKQLLSNPRLGTDLGNGIYKVRMAIASKGKGKSAGARVITYVIEEREDETIVHLLTIYDKSEIENVSDQFIQTLIKQI